ncbi:MAG: Hsp20/alpha crystallin family protein [Gammaproteobacteria bacterium]|nr:Hsp20/alpha crystallin family protein [Gammaproteobacteria bacterium]
MWADACALVEEAERMHRRFFDLLATPATAPTWEPPVNVFATGPEIQIAVALPGVEPGDITVGLHAAGLLIDAQLGAPALAPHADVVRLEIPYGRVHRRIPLPPGRYELLERRLANGCLYLRIAEVHR